MWNNLKKAVTFSFDDGIIEDKKCIEILNKYGLKATFNVNTGLSGVVYRWMEGTTERKVERLLKEDYKEIYKGHEIASHSLTHPSFENCSKEEILKEVNDDIKELERITGVTVTGFAYPNGLHDDVSPDYIRDNAKVHYARAAKSNYSFNVQNDLFRFYPTIHMIEPNLDEIIDTFLNSESDDDQILYIWGHTYECTNGLFSFEKFENMCKKLANKKDIFYGTNNEVLCHSEDGIIK